MIYFKYDEDTHECSICYSKGVEKELSFKIHDGATCSFWIEPQSGKNSLKIDNWEFRIDEILFTTFPTLVEENGDSFVISAKENNVERVITIKKTGKFEDSNEIWNSIQNAIDKIINRDVWTDNTFILSEDEKITCSVTKKYIQELK